MPAELVRISVFCFAASYCAALAVDLLRILRSNSWLRWLSLAATAAGLIAHTLYLVGHPLPLQTAFGSLVFLAWVLAIFSIYGTVHHARLAWSLFVLPLVLALIGLAVLISDVNPNDAANDWAVFSLRGEHFWAIFHGALMLLAAVGISVAFVASVMYLVQSRRLKTKRVGVRGLQLWNLERLEMMQRRGIVLAFPLLTCGLLIAGIQTLRIPTGSQGLDSIKVLSTVSLWVVFAILLYLRYGTHTGGKRIALWTIAAFSLMLIALAAVHPFAQGGLP